LGNLRQYLATRLATLREAKGWNQHDLAAACEEIAGRKRSVSWIRGYEQQTRWPDPEDLELLAKALGLDDPAILIAPPRKPTPAEAMAVLAELVSRSAPANLDDALKGADPAAVAAAKEGQAIGAETKQLLRKVAHKPR
jgi:transcriptional regulator with XRE-family HTH domain